MAGSDNLYIKGLPWNATEQLLRELFEQCGQVLSTRIFPPQGTNGDATAMVRMGGESEALLAIKTLNGAALGTGDEAPPMSVRYHGPKNAPASDNLYIKGLPSHATEQACGEVFSAHGSCVSVRLFPPKPPNVDNTALVRMSSQEEAASVIAALNGTAFPGAAPAQGSQLTVRLADSAKKKEDKVMSRAPQQAPPMQMGRMQTQVVQPPHFGKGRAAPPQFGKGRAPFSQFSDAYSFYTGRPAAQQALEVRFHGAKNAAPSDNLYVKGLPVSASNAEVQELFGRYGAVASMRLMPPDMRHGAADSTALVRMGSVDEASAVIDALNGADAGSAFSYGSAPKPSPFGHRQNAPY